MIRIFRVFVPASTVLLAAFETAILAVLFSLSIYLLVPDPILYLLDDLGLVRVALVVVSFLIGIYFQNLYSEVLVSSRLLLIQQFIMVGGIAFLVQALLAAVNPDLCMLLRPMLVGSAASVIVLCAGRLLFTAYVVPRLDAENLVLLGESPLLHDIANHVHSHPQLGIQIAAHLPSVTATQSSSLEEQLRPFDSKRIVVGLFPHLGYESCNELLQMRFLGYSVDEASATYAKLFSREGLAELSISRIVYDKEFEPTARTLLFQALRTWSIAGLFLVVSAPLLLLIAVALRVTGPVLEPRICRGYSGKPFKLYRFRVGSDWLGRILSRTGFYALPQLFNVFRGELMLIGPRPERVEVADVLARCIPIYHHRFNVLPGMTGWAQIQGRRLPGLRNSIADLEYDLYYIKYISSTMDIFLIAQAIKNVVIWGAQP